MSHLVITTKEVMREGWNAIPLPRFTLWSWAYFGGVGIIFLLCTLVLLILNRQADAVSFALSASVSTGMFLAITVVVYLAGIRAYLSRVVP